MGSDTYGVADMNKLKIGDKVTTVYPLSKEGGKIIKIYSADETPYGESLAVVCLDRDLKGYRPQLVRMSLLDKVVP